MSPEEHARHRANDALDRLEATARSLRELIAERHPAMDVCQSLVTAASDTAMRVAQADALARRDVTPSGQ